MAKGRISALSRKVKHKTSIRLDSGRYVSQTKHLNAKQIVEQKKRDNAAMVTRFKELDSAQRTELKNLQQNNVDTNCLYSDMELDDPDAEAASNFLAGQAPIDISHAGGEFEAIFEGLDDELLGHQKVRRRVQDYRTRRDRTELRNKAFMVQMEDLVDAYMHWSMGSDGLTPEYTAPGGSEDGERSVNVLVVDVFESGPRSIVQDVDVATLAISLVKQGLLPCAPFRPSVAITIRAVELFRVTHLRCPHLAVEPFVKALCDIHGVPFRQYLAQQFRICFDLYNVILNMVDHRVKAALQRDHVDWRLQNACPACTYRLEGEADLTYCMLYTMDGNDSLKRILRHERAQVPGDDGEPEISISSEYFDSRKPPGDYYLTQDEVDRWAKEALLEMLPGEDEAAAVSGGGDNENPCAGRWKNMANDITAKMWGIFDETGVFLALCRHGFVLVIANMVRSGELAKYPLAIVSKLLKIFGIGLGAGYDIGCKFDTTLSNSSLGPEAAAKCHSCLVGAFHGHAHNCLCQLKNLATYVSGLGLEDLEGCERFFSKSNALAKSTRYASAFHCRQAIASYCKHVDNLETYHSLSNFLLNNYRQALAILDTRPQLQRTMASLGVTDESIFAGWLKEERKYLESLTKEPLIETLEMEYYQKLVNLLDSQEKLDTARNAWNNVTSSTFDGTNNFTAKMETARRHTLERQDRDMKIVQDLEIRLNLSARWKVGGEEWEAAAKKVKMRKYQRAINTLEGYKLRKHISKALQARSPAIRNALDRYNAAAAALRPARRQLSWEEVVDYAFLADFDLLRDTRNDVRVHTWATPAGRLAMDQYFKLQRAEEEIQRLNTEIPRVITYIRDEAIFLKSKEEETRRSDPPLAHQIAIYRKERGRFDNIHMKHFQTIAKLHGFTGSILPGKPLSPSPLPSPCTPGVPVLVPCATQRVPSTAILQEHHDVSGYPRDNDEYGRADGGGSGDNDDGEDDDDEGYADSEVDNDDRSCFKARVNLLILSEDSSSIVHSES